VQKIVIEIVIQIGKPCSTMQQIMIEIDTEQAQLYQCDRSTMPIFVTEIVIDFSERAVLVLKNSD